MVWTAARRHAIAQHRTGNRAVVPQAEVESPWAACKEKRLRGDRGSLGICRAVRLSTSGGISWEGSDSRRPWHTTGGSCSDSARGCIQSWHLASCSEDTCREERTTHAGRSADGRTGLRRHTVRFFWGGAEEGVSRGGRGAGRVGRRPDSPASFQGRTKVADGALVGLVHLRAPYGTQPVNKQRLPRGPVLPCSGPQTFLKR